MDKWMGIYSDQFTKEETEFQSQRAKEDFEKNKIFRLGAATGAALEK